MKSNSNSINNSNNLNRLNNPNTIKNLSNPNNLNNATPTSKPQIRCAIYTRKSCEEGLELEYNSLDNQYDSCRKYIESQKLEGWVLATEVKNDKDNIGNKNNGNDRSNTICVPKRYDDGGYSGGNLERPALKELIKDIENNLIDMVVVYKIDRLSRSLMDFSKLVDIFNKNSTSFISVTQNFNTNDSMGKLMLNILLSFAQFEREMTGDRIRDKIRMQKSKGMWTGGAVPLGYDIIEKKLIINEEESKKVKLIFNTFIRTRSISETLKVLNNPSDPLNTFKEVLKTKSRVSKKNPNNNIGNKRFNKTYLYEILKNKIYNGLIENKNTNSIYQGIHEAIIDDDTFNKVQEIFKMNLNIKMYDNGNNYNNSNNNDNNNNNINKTITINNRGTIEHKIIHTPKLNTKMPYLLKGLMRCSCCNSILTPTYTIKKNGIAYRYYKSNKSLKHTLNETTGEGCKLKSIPAEQIENIVLNQIYSIIRTPNIIQKIIDATMNKKDEVENEEKDKAIISENQINKNSINQQNNNSVDKTMINSQEINSQTIINHLKNIESVWEELPIREQIEIINILIKEIIISNDNIKVIFNKYGFIRIFDSDFSINPNVRLNTNLKDNPNANNNKNTSSSSDSNSNIEVNIPIQLKYKASRSFITTPNGTDIIIKNTLNKKSVSNNYRDDAIVNALIQAEQWKKELESSNNYSITVSTIAKREHKQNSYICRILNLTFLAPDIKKAILMNKCPLGLSLKDIRTSLKANLSWDDQRKRLGFI
ncbi:MAG TPA: recombinase family protein [Rickettsiales bacterium]|nr:recombinase family protein [Rickettsiales bacterium]